MLRSVAMESNPLAVDFRETESFGLFLLLLR